MKMKMKKVVQVFLLTIAITAATMVAATTNSRRTSDNKVMIPSRIIPNILLNNNNAGVGNKLVGDGLSCQENGIKCYDNADCCSGYCPFTYPVPTGFCKWCPTPGYPCGLLDPCCPGYTCQYEQWYHVTGACV